MRNTPSDIEVMLHFYYSPERHPRESAPAVQNAIVGFMNDGLLREREGLNQHGSRFETTGRGKAWVEMICATPYPEQAWTNPLTGNVVDFK